MGSAAPPKQLCRPSHPSLSAALPEGLWKVQCAHLRRSTELSPGRGRGSWDKGLMERWEPHLLPKERIKEA